MSGSKRSILIIIVIALLAFLVWFAAGRKTARSPQPNSSQPNNSAASNLNPFVNVPGDLLQKDPSITVTPDQGYILTTSIKSHDGAKAAYAEISDCIGKLNATQNGSTPVACNWTFKIKTQDLADGAIKQIYSFPPDKSPLEITLIPVAQAGGCELVPFPLGWSAHDQKIILQWGNPTACGSGGVPKFETYTLNAKGGVLTGLSTTSGFLVENNQEIIYVSDSTRSPRLCGPGGTDNFGRIVIKNVETGRFRVLAEQPNSYYELKAVSDNILTYTRRPNLLDTGQCGSVDFTVQPPGQQLNF